MNLYIFHYHLNPGGVTRIIESQIESLKQSGVISSICLITGNCEDRRVFEEKGVEVVIDEEFNYLNNSENLEAKYNHIYNRLHEICSENGIMHFHNLNLGKNPVLTLVVSEMAHEGYSILNHAHDFAEDRPANYSFIGEVFHKLTPKPVEEVLYPNLPNYHIATLNTPDLNRIQGKLIPNGRCHLLPNPVMFNETLQISDAREAKDEIIAGLKLDKRKLNVVYPVRVIRRKNIAEFILLSVLYKEKANWIVTQPPKNPIEVEHYKQWKDFCAGENIKVFWESGQKVDFEQLLQVADFCVSTSIREGFGMVFIEPWLLNTPVIGRDIPMVTEDLKLSGIEFPVLYTKLLAQENKEIHELNIEEQMYVVKKYNDDPDKHEFLFKLNPFLDKMLNLVPEALVKKNKEVILKEFSPAKYTRRLDEIYREFA